MQYKFFQRYLYDCFPLGFNYPCYKRQIDRLHLSKVELIITHLSEIRMEIRRHKSEGILVIAL